MDFLTLNEFLVNPSKTFKKWFKRVLDKQTPWTENEIIYFRKYIGSSGSATPEQKQLLMSSFYGDYSITQEQSNKGIQYLRKVCFRKNGGLRETKDMNDNGYTNYCHYMPVYKVIASNGDSFEYVAGSMGQITVVA